VVKLPAPPPAGELHYEHQHLYELNGDTVLWRVHRTAGGHVVGWDQLRYWGPSTAMRFDPHEPPPRVQDRGVSYTALSVPTALAEVFQQRRVINTHRGAPYLTGWIPSRTLMLLDLTGRWPIYAGASHVLNTGRRDICRSWARAIHTKWPELDGLRHHSAMTGGDAVTLFTVAADSFPTRPTLSLPLDHPGLRAHILDAATQISYRIV
jgi:hypothetical protein